MSLETFEVRNRQARLSGAKRRSGSAGKQAMPSCSNWISLERNSSLDPPIELSIVKSRSCTRSTTRGWKRYFYLLAIHQFLRDAPAVDVHIVTQEPGWLGMLEHKLWNINTSW